MTDEALHRARTARAFGITVRTLREQVGIGQERFAAQVGLDRAHMSVLERGHLNPKMETVFKLLPHLGVTFVQFAGVFEMILEKLQ